jgi:hypothetical protein
LTAQGSPDGTFLLAGFWYLQAEGTMATAAQIAANLKNAQRSCGPRTATGKSHSKVNALKHGMRSKTLIFPEDDASAFHAKLDALTAEIQPRNANERECLEDYVSSSWRLQRVLQAQVARAYARLESESSEQASREREEALALAKRLFGSLYETDAGDQMHAPAVSLRDELRSLSSVEPTIGSDHPARLVLRLRGKLAGCEWMLARWSEFEAKLDQNLPLRPTDSAKAIRMLGSEPAEAFQDREVAIIFFAGFVLRGPETACDKESSRLARDHGQCQSRSLAGARDAHAFLPRSPSELRTTLLQIAGRERAGLEAEVEELQQLAALDAADAPARLLTDRSPAGRRLRQYELQCTRATDRSFDRLLDLIRNRNSTVTTDALRISGTTREIDATFDLGAAASTSTTPINVASEPEVPAPAPSEPPAAPKNTTNEPNFATNDWRPACEHSRARVAEPQNATNEANSPCDTRSCRQRIRRKRRSIQRREHRTNRHNRFLRAPPVERRAASARGAGVRDHNQHGPPVRRGSPKARLRAVKNADSGAVVRKPPCYTGFKQWFDRFLGGR